MKRIELLDSIRGIALLGILLVNILIFGIPEMYHFNLSLQNELTGVNFWVWLITNGFFEGTMRALFSILFGASSILLIDSLQKKHQDLFPADIYYRRLIWLLFFGIFDAFVLLWPGDILFQYAIAGLFLFPFRNLSPKILLGIAFFLLIVNTGKEYLQWNQDKKLKARGEYALRLEKKKAVLNASQVSDLQKWKEAIQNNQPEALHKKAKESIEKMKGNWYNIYQYQKNSTIQQQTTLFYGIVIWDVLLFMFLGMALYKSGILTGLFSVKFYFLLMLAAYGFGLFLSYSHLSFYYEARFDYVKTIDKNFLHFYHIRRIFLALGHLSLICLLYKSGIFQRFFWAMAQVGKMAFTHYLMQSLICTLIFYGYGLAYFGRLERYQLYLVVGGIWVFQVIFSIIWFRFFTFGPLEWLWKILTYLKIYSLKKEKRMPEETIFTSGKS